MNEKDGVEFHQGKIFFSDCYLKESNVKTNAPTKIANPGDIIFCVRAPVGVVNITERQICIGRGLAALSPKPNIPRYYLFSLLNTLKNQFEKVAAGSTFSSISGPQLKQFPVTIHSDYDTMKQIASELYSIDSMISSLQKIITKQEAIKKSTVKLLMTPKEGWKEKSLAEMGEFFKGGGVTMKDTVSHGVPCTMYGDIYVKYNIMFDHVDYFLPPSKAAKATKAIYGDLLFTASGETAIEIGKCAGYFGNTPICIGGDIIALRPNDDFDSLFLAYLFNSNGCIRQKARLGQGDAVVHIKVSNLSSIKLFVPPTKSEQIIIAKQINELDNQLLVIKQKLSKAEAMKQGMMRYFFGN